MTSKLKVSSEVAEALDDLFSRNEINYPKEWILQEHYEAINEGDKWSGERWKHLNKLTMSEMAQAMFIGYEAEEHFRVGDWVKQDIGGGFKIGKITEIKKIIEY